MGYNTVAVLYNDQTDRWGERIKSAALGVGFNGKPESFGYGVVVSCDHADGVQVVVVGRNTGRRLSPFHFASGGDLEALACILQAHGYGVRGPDEKRVRSPLGYGFAATRKEPET